MGLKDYELIIRLWIERLYYELIIRLIIDGLRCSLSLGKTSLDAKSEIKEFEILSLSSNWLFGLFGPRFPTILKAPKIPKLV